MRRYDPVCAPTQQSDLPPLTPEDLYAFRFLTDAQISPDGARVAFAVRTVNDERDGYRSALWLVPRDGSREATRLTFGPGQDASPRWSPDGAALAFASDRFATEKDPKKRKPKNVFVLSLDGGEARQLTAFDDDCADLAWSPDGRRIVFVVRDPKQQKDGDGEAESIRVYERMRYKSDEGFLWDERRRHVWVVDVARGEPRRLTDGEWDDLQPSWSPDGGRIAFVSNRTAERERNTVADIWTVAVAECVTTRVTDEVGSYGNPSWSPDGARISCYGVEKAIGSDRDVPQALRALLVGSDAVDALWLPPDPLLLGEDARRYIFQETLKAGRPVYAFSAALVQEGALVSNGADMANTGEQAGELLLRLLGPDKGARIELAIPRAELVINKKIADRLSIGIPAEVLKAAAKVF